MQRFDAVVSIYDTAEQIKEKLRSVCNSRDGEASQELLSAREKEIIVGVVKGLTNKQIAERLFISAHTVITHRRNIAAKLQIHSPAGLTIYAIVNKLVELNDVKNTKNNNCRYFLNFVKWRFARVRPGVVVSGHSVPACAAKEYFVLSLRKI